MQSVIDFFQSGGFVMYPLLIASIAIWFIVFERIWRFRKLRLNLKLFKDEALNILLSGDSPRLQSLCTQNREVPTAHLVQFAMQRLESKDERIRNNWKKSLARERLEVNQDLRKHLWVLGTIASASPFVGLFGTVVGILQSFRAIAATGQGGFEVVAAGISEALIATAAGIIVAVVALLFFNAFQTQWSQIVLTIRNHLDELTDMLDQGTSSGSA